MCTGKLNYMKKVGLKNDGHFEKVYSQKMVQKLSLGRYLLCTGTSMDPLDTNMLKRCAVKIFYKA